MTPMDPRTRIGDADREQAVGVLQRYVTDGYLSLDEFSDRSAAAYRAKTYGELAALTADLAPRPEPGHPRASASQNRWSPLMIVVAVLVGAVVLAAVVMVLMMLGMMGGMGMMG